MLDFKEAKQTLEYYGFKSKSVEPILIENNKKIGIFVTLKTKYGYLSRYITFTEKEKLQEFLKQYINYQRQGNNAYVEFDNYEVLSPKVNFEYKEEVIIPQEVEELEVETTGEDNIKLLDIVLDKVKDQIKVIDNVQTDLQKLIKEYLNKLMEFNTKLGRDSEQISTNINVTNIKEYSNNIDSIKEKAENSDDISFVKIFDEAINLYENTLLDNTYLDNLYLTECYKEELRRTNEMINSYNNFSADNKKKLWKKNSQTFEDYLIENPISENIIEQNDLNESIKIEASNKLIELKNNSIEDLKKIYNIVIVPTKKEVEEPLEITGSITDGLDNYYNNLTLSDKKDIIALSSPLKELINMLIDLEDDKYNKVIEEKYLFKKFMEIYNMISNEDNYPLSKKAFGKLKLDSFDEFLQSLIDMTENITTNMVSIPAHTILKFKMGVLMKKGYVNASIEDNYPVNSKGENSYYVVDIKNNIPVYFMNKIVLLKPDNTLEAKKNDDIITFKIDGYKFSDKKEIKVNNYIYKKQDFTLFNEKKYISCKMENGEINE